MAAERPHIARLALNPTLSSGLVARVAVDDDPPVRLAVPARPGLPGEVDPKARALVLRDPGANPARPRRRSAGSAATRSAGYAR
jgi:hypothetical protein